VLFDPCDRAVRHLYRALADEMRQVRLVPFVIDAADYQHAFIFLLRLHAWHADEHAFSRVRVVVDAHHIVLPIR
jgi:hypothetical protein